MDLSSSKAMRHDQVKEHYVAPRIFPGPLVQGRSVLLNFSLEGDIEAIVEDDAE